MRVELAHGVMSVHTARKTSLTRGFLAVEVVLCLQEIRFVPLWLWLWLFALSSIASTVVETVVGVESGVQERGETVGEKLYIGTSNIARLAVAGSAFTSKAQTSSVLDKLLAETFYVASLANEESACYQWLFQSEKDSPHLTGKSE